MPLVRRRTRRKVRRGLIRRLAPHSAVGRMTLGATVCGAGAALWLGRRATKGVLRKTLRWQLTDWCELQDWYLSRSRSAPSTGAHPLHADRAGRRLPS